MGTVAWITAIIAVWFTYTVWKNRGKEAFHWSCPICKKHGIVLKISSNKAHIISHEIRRHNETTHGVVYDNPEPGFKEF